ncbi:MAG: hypothetical protein A3A86_03245 [Elusimicrobia bacterium RIFCSPLOWO2_01_FULL_60_11]|nr:MAG: hypothetical protein A3A86_03245 [Elusimicrobia bacterium RIFCSPLOWO2_01_FULL_60_11]
MMAVAASLTSEAPEIVPGRPFWVSVHLAMEKGWHTYSDPPGDSGLPTEVAWELPPGFSAGKIVWPKPRKFTEGGITDHIYEGAVDLKVKITPPKAIKVREATLKAHVKWLECKDICRPGSARVSLTLPVRKAVSGGGT